jgi:dipeptidyl aminopeptidase/acylaminoacyl peptidase
MIYEAERPEVIWLDPDFKAVQVAMDKTLADHVNLPIDWSEDGSTFIYLSASDRDPGTFYVFRPFQSTLIPLLALGDRLKGKKLARTVPFDYAARDGASIHAYVTFPPDPSPGLLPLVVDIHGGPMERDVWGFNPETQFLATRGYVVLQVNYRGSSGYGATYQKAGLRARLDTVVIDDIADGARHLINEGKVDPSRIGVIGASFGGWATYMSLIRYPDLYRTGVAISAVSHWRSFLKDDRSKYDNKASYAYWKSLLDSQGFKTDEALIDPLLRAAELKQPIYVIHGTLDHIVSVEEATMMTKTLQKTNSQVESLIFPQAGHTYYEWGFYDKVRRLNEIGEYLDRHLKAGTPAAAVERGAQPAPEAGAPGVEAPAGVTPPASSSAGRR